MKTFEDYKDGDWVVYINPKSEWHHLSFQAFKSKYTHDAFRLRFGDREVIADISEIKPIGEINTLLKEEESKFSITLPKGYEIDRHVISRDDDPDFLD